MKEKPENEVFLLDFNPKIRARELYSWISLVGKDILKELDTPGNGTLDIPYYYYVIYDYFAKILNI
ncbi:MAG: hypothetical protein BAJALOKI2v1_840004 [Promethearchaeota archaeon]|nr:MAG: hypothetical protein BAJALOKI2v1_840004 [Candidatus Lokiarchaeota archaeon]